MVEFVTEPFRECTILEFLPPELFEYPDLMPETTFYYLVRGPG